MPNPGFSNFDLGSVGELALPRACMLRTTCLLYAVLLAAGSAPRYEQYPPRHLEPGTDPRQWSVSDVQDWVESIGFHEYRGAFLEAAVDGKRLLSELTAGWLADELILGSDEHNMVIEMELSELRARRGLMSGAEARAFREAYPPVDEWDVAQVGNFLEKAGLGSFSPQFAAAQVDGPALLRLSDAELEQLVQLSDGSQKDEIGEAATELVAAAVRHLRWRAGPGTDRDEL